MFFRRSFAPSFFRSILPMAYEKRITQNCIFALTQKTTERIPHSGEWCYPVRIPRAQISPIRVQHFRCLRGDDVFGGVG